MRIFRPFSLLLHEMKFAANMNSNPALFNLLSLSSKRLSTLSSSPNPIIVNYLIQTFGFSQTLANSISNRFWWAKSTENPQSVIHFLRDLGFSEAHIRTSVRVAPQILFSDIDKTLKPKVQFFEQLGLVGADLGKFISKNSKVLTISLEKKLVPCIEILKKTLSGDENNGDLIRVLRRCTWVLSRNPELLLSNIAFLESCGIVGSQLSMLLTRQPRLFVIKQSTLKDLVSRAVDMGFSIESRMLVYALYTISCLRDETLRKKFELFRSWGFTEQECIEMFRRTPGLLRASEEKLKLGMEFFMNTMKFEKTLLVHRPTILMLSMEDRVIPRYRVLQILKSKRLLKREPSFINVLSLTDEEFLDKFISRFADDAEELLVAYKGHSLQEVDE